MNKHEFLGLASNGDVEIEELWVERRYAVRKKDAIFPAVFMTMRDDDTVIDTDEVPALFTDGDRNARLAEWERNMIRKAIIRFQSQ